MSLVVDRKLVSSVEAFVQTLYRRAPIRGLEPEDIVQDVLERLWRSADRYDAKISPSASAWAYMIARNRYFDLARSRQRKAAREAGKVDATVLPSKAPRPDESAAVAEEIGHVKRALAGLPELARDVLLARATGERADLRDLAVETGLSYKRTVYLSASAAGGVRRAVELATRPPPDRDPPVPGGRVRFKPLFEGSQVVFPFRQRPRGFSVVMERRRLRRLRAAREGWVQQVLPWAA